MKVWQIGVFGVALVLLAGCKSFGLGGKRVDYGAGATQVPALEVPPDLTTPAGDERYRVPQGNGDGVANFSDYRQGGASAGRGADAVLPEVKDVRLERSGTQRWLAVNDKPGSVWAVVKAFWQENGIAIKSEDHAAGVMETDWVESRADKAPSYGERDQYRVRLERGKDGAGTEVYITHRGMVEVPDADGKASKWQARPNDPEMEAVMLQRLMARFADDGRQATDGTSGQTGAAYLREIDGNRIIVVNDTFDRSWRRVGLAIEHAGLVVEDRDRARGIYFLRPPKVENGWLDKLQFWKESANTNVRYRVNVRDGGALCEVSVTSADGASDNASRQLVDEIYKNINPGGTGAAASVSAIDATGPAGTASMQEVFDGSKVVVVNDTFDRSWQKVGVAIERAGLAVENSDRASGVYFLRSDKAESGLLDKVQFWKEDAGNLRYRVNVRDGGRACEVSVTDQDGASDDASSRMIEEIFRNIGQ